MKRFLTMLKIEGKLGLRCPDGVIFGIGMPIGILMLIAVVGGSSLAMGTEYTFLQSAFPSLLTVGICATAFMGIPLTFADYRDKKILKHFFVTPVSPLLMMLVQVFIAMFTSIISALSVSLIAIFVFQYRMDGNLLGFVGAYFLTMFSMYSIGMIIASLCKTVKIANLVTSFVYFPMLFLSGATIPFELFPTFLRNICTILPLTHGIQLLKNISMGITTSANMTSIWILLAFLVVGVIISIRCFKWE